MSDTYYWQQKDGTYIDIREMEDAHIKRCFKYLPKDSEWFDVFNDELQRRKNEIKTSINEPSPVSVSIGLSRMPRHCGECPLFINTSYYDEDAAWDDGIVHYCLFGSDTYGCLVERPQNCPLKEKQNI